MQVPTCRNSNTVPEQVLQVTRDHITRTVQACYTPARKRKALLLLARCEGSRLRFVLAAAAAAGGRSRQAAVLATAKPGAADAASRK